MNSSKKNALYRLSGWAILLIIWFLITNLNLINNHIMPTPQKTLKSLISMYNEESHSTYKEAFISNFGILFLGNSPKSENLIENLLFSVRINISGYLLAIISSVLFGFAIGVFPKVRKMFSQQVNALRFVPITALMGVFIAISGITVMTKINFLAFGIWVYLVPVVVQRIDEVDEVYLQMMKTLGATRWQTFKYVTWKSVTSRLSDDIRILVGISWTYIIVAELTGMQGGVGELIWLGQKQANVGIVYGVILVIIAFGMLQDFLFLLADKKVYKFKYV